MSANSPFPGDLSDQNGPVEFVVEVNNGSSRWFLGLYTAPRIMGPFNTRMAYLLENSQIRFRRAMDERNGSW